MKLALGLLLAAVTVTVAALLNPLGRLRAQATPAPEIPAPELATPYVTLGMVALAPGQTARLNALLLPVGGPIIAGGSCQVTLAFLDDQGKTLASATLPVNQNQAVHFDYPAPSTASAMEIRGTVDAEFIITGGSTALLPGRCSVVPTLEIYNPINGQTQVALTQVNALPQVVALATAP